MRRATNTFAAYGFAWLGVGVLAGLLCAAEVRAQLAITEAMSWASIDCPGCEGSGNRGCRPDFWELTNFGDREVNLHGYRYIDKDGKFPDASWRVDRDVIVQPNESVIFLRAGWDLVPDSEAFRSWWGISDDVQIICCYPAQGLDDRGDAVRLFDTASNIVDQFFFDVTQRGFTFTYDTNCGAAVQSELGVCGAFRAAACADVGSPGWAPCGPVPLRITQQPVNQTVDAGSDVKFTVEACGLPRPRGYQWYFNDTAVPSAAAADTIPTLVNYAGCGLAWKTAPKATDLFIPNVQPAHAGQYFVVMTNGLERLTSAVVTLTVNTTPMPPRIECPPLDWCFSGVLGRWETNLIVAEFQTARFEVVARGYPLPTFRWSWSADGSSFRDLPGETNSTFIVTPARPDGAGIYRVRVQNAMGTNFAFAQLSVKEKPQLRITEAMSSECFTAANDWWELTNVGDEPVNLCGYRWDNSPAIIGGGPTITNAVIVQPGESVIFLEGRTPEFFTAWWGTSNLPPGLQFVTYTANGLDSRGDEEINLWNPTAGEDWDWIDQAIFSEATTGSSFWFDTEACPASSVLSPTNGVGQCGAFRSVQGCDVGSPGWTRWTPPRLTSIRRDGPQVLLEWRAQPGSTNVVQYTRELASPAGVTGWTNLGTNSFAGASCLTNDTTLGTDQQRFYRVQMASPAQCHCPDFDE